MPITKPFTHNQFNDIADILLNKSQLVVKDKRFRLCEIEFYYKGKDHEDTYTHCSDDQLEFGRFYFHKFKNGSYKSGTYKGMDLTFGDKKNNLYCGILIRSMMDIDTNDFIEGPCKCVNKILEIFGFDDVAGFMAEGDDRKVIDIYKKKYQLYIQDTATLNKEDIYVGPRVGLSDKYPDYKLKDYRYATMIKLIKKQKKFTILPNKTKN
jgi:hypothetical protein